jgi:biopolymer transport protein ExbB/TolQ
MLKSLSAWFNAGGPFMWIILGVCALACAVTFERMIFYYLFCRQNGLKQIVRLSQALTNEKPEEAKLIVNRDNAPLTILLRTAVEHYLSGHPYADIQEGVEEAAIQQIPRLPQRLNYLSLFANIATLLGLLGTISGLQISFASLASMEASNKATMLASGISQAMITTWFGLVVAIPCMAMYTFLSNKQARITKDLDEATVKFLNFLRKKRP